MTAPSAIALVEEIRQLGGHLRAKEGGKLGLVLAEPDLSRLLPAVRERKPDLLMLLRYPSTACPACSGDRFWRDGVGTWRCAKCDPDSPPDPFGPLPAGEEDAVAELELRAKLREPEYARLLVPGPDGPCSLRSLAIRAAAVVWAAGGPEGIARRRAEAWASIPPALLEGRKIVFTAPAGAPAIAEWVRTPAGRTGEVLAFDSAGRVLVRTLDGSQAGWFSPAALVAEIDWDRRPA